MLVLLLPREISGNLFLNFPNYKVLKAMCQTLSGWVYSVTPQNIQIFTADIHYR